MSRLAREILIRWHFHLAVLCLLASAFSCAQPNRPPEVIAPLSIEGVAGEWIEVEVGVRDPDGDPVTITVLGVPSAHIVDWIHPDVAVLRWAPLPSEGSPDGIVWPVDFVARDSRGAEGRATTVVRVVRTPIPPMLDMPGVLPLPFAAKQTLATLITAVDPDSAEVDLLLAEGPEGMALVQVGPKRAVLTWTPTETQRLGPRLLPLQVEAQDNEAPPEVFPSAVALIDPGASPCPGHPPTIAATWISDLPIGEPLLARAMIGDPDGGPLSARLWLWPRGATAPFAVDLSPSRPSSDPVEWITPELSAVSFGIEGPSLVQYWLEATSDDDALGERCDREARWPTRGTWAFVWGGGAEGECLDDELEGATRGASATEEPVELPTNGMPLNLRLCADSDLWRFDVPPGQQLVVDVEGPPGEVWARVMGDSHAPTLLPARFSFGPGEESALVDIEVLSSESAHYRLQWGASPTPPCVPKPAEFAPLGANEWASKVVLCAGGADSLAIPQLNDGSVAIQFWLDSARSVFDIELDQADWLALPSALPSNGDSHRALVALLNAGLSAALRVRTAPGAPGGDIQILLSSGAQASPCEWTPPPPLTPWVNSSLGPLRLCPGSDRAFRSGLNAGETLVWAVEELGPGPGSNRQIELWAQAAGGEWMPEAEGAAGVWESPNGSDVELRVLSNDVAAEVRLLSNVLPSGGCAADRFEPNDTPDAAYSLLEGPSIRLSACEEPDWYMLSAALGEVVQLHLSAVDAELHAQLFDARGDLVAEGVAAPGQAWWSESAVIWPPLKLRVSKFVEHTTYHLHWNR